MSIVIPQKISDYFQQRDISWVATETTLIIESEYFSTNIIAETIEMLERSNYSLVTSYNKNKCRPRLRDILVAGFVFRRHVFLDKFAELLERGDE